MLAADCFPVWFMRPLPPAGHVAGTVVRHLRRHAARRIGHGVAAALTAGGIVLPHHTAPPPAGWEYEVRCGLPEGWPPPLPEQWVASGELPFGPWFVGGPFGFGPVPFVPGLPGVPGGPALPLVPGGVPEFRQPEERRDVPEPGTWVLLLVPLAAAWAARRRG